MGMEEQSDANWNVNGCVMWGCHVGPICHSFTLMFFFLLDGTGLFAIFLIVTILFSYFFGPGKTRA